ncbi:uncharacterized protein BDV17DRAFT_35836 [Aspergillus undulatus]|uniref:uncharacterized protein n=1 Tax=Aspergillus undulatus TaxID=1810928 RepID=UPI003CCD0F37
MCISFNWDLLLACICIVAAYRNLQRTTLLVHIIALAAGYPFYSDFSGGASKDQAFAFDVFPFDTRSIYRFVLLMHGDPGYMCGFSVRNVQREEDCDIVHLAEA